MEFRDNEARSRFELLDGDDVVAFADYTVAGETVVADFIEANPDYQDLLAA